MVARGLSDAEISSFERVCNGVDWRWFPDPWRMVRCAWVPGDDGADLSVYDALAKGEVA